MSDTAIHIDGLTKVYSSGTQALKGIDLKVKSGDFFALLGANGAGKTTIIGILTNLIKKTSGSASIYGHDIDFESIQARKIMGAVPQEMNFNLFEKVFDIVVNQAGYYGISRHEAKRRTTDILKRLQLWDKKDAVSRSLSGGMKRRLMIARALVNQPKLLILDEPTAGVDVELRYSMWEFIKKINQEGTTILLTTHYLEEVEQLCRNAAIIKNGEIITCDTVKNLIKLVDCETYVVQVNQLGDLDGLANYDPKKIDEHTFEVEIDKGDKLHDFIMKVTSLGMKVTDFRPKGNRLEKLFLNILSQKHHVLH